MRLSFLIPILFVPVITGFSQSINTKADSLIRQINAAQDIDTRLELYGAVAWAYLYTRTQLDQARQYIDTLNLLATKYKTEKWTARAEYLYGVRERFLGNHDAALQFLERYTSYCKHAGDSNWVADGLFQIGSIHLKKGDYVKGLETFHRVVSIDRSMGKISNVAHSLNSIGSIFFNMMKYQEAIQAYTESLKIYDSLNRTEATSNVHVNLGNVYTKLKNFDLAKDHYLTALAINRTKSDSTGIAVTLANLAFMFDGMDQYDSALSYHLKALEIRARLPDKDFLTRSLIGVGIGYTYTEQFTNAETYLSQALSLAKEIGSKPMVRDIYFCQSELYAKMGKFAQAYESLNLHKAFNDSLINDENSRLVSELQTKYDTEYKNRQIAVLENEKLVDRQAAERQALMTKGILAVLLLVVLIAIAIIYATRQRLASQRLIAKKNEELREAHFQRQLSDLELKALRAQINPHFLFNCLNSINRMILEGDTANASRYLAKFAKLVRLILENSATDQISLEQELAMLEAYIQLEELRYREKIQYTIAIEEDVKSEDTFLPPMILQPFVENAIWHGLMHRERKENGHIKISIRGEDKSLCCSIEDNGIGREKARLFRDDSVLKTKSMGIKITEERLRLLSGDKLKELIQITDLLNHDKSPSGTRVEIKIPIDVLAE